MSDRVFRRVVGSFSALLCLGALAACSNSGTTSGGTSQAAVKPSTSASTVPHAAESKYNPKIDPNKFTPHITNPYFPLQPGSTRIAFGRKDGVPQLHKATVVTQTRVVMGVKCVVVDDIVTSNGKLAEKTSDWYAQDDQGNVWYFGEATADFENGIVTSTAGSWEAGIDNAKPGIVMQAQPKPGPTYYQEFRPGVAEDRGRVLRTDAQVKVPAGSFKDVVVIKDTNPLDPTLVQHKWYAKGVGLVKTIRTGSSHSERSRLIKIKNA